MATRKDGSTIKGRKEIDSFREGFDIKFNIPLDFIAVLENGNVITDGNRTYYLRLEDIIMVERNSEGVEQDSFIYKIEDAPLYVKNHYIDLLKMNLERLGVNLKQKD